jgi:hypothetical protein
VTVPPKGIFGKVWIYFWWLKLGVASDFYQVEVGRLPNHLQCTEHLLTQKSYLSQNVSRANVKKPWPAISEGGDVRTVLAECKEEGIRRFGEVDSSSRFIT